MKKRFVLIFLSLSLNIISVAQETLEGDRLLDLIGRPVTDPLNRQFRQQEDFYNDYWNRSFTVTVDLAGDKITEIQFENGQKKFQSEERYGYYKKALPLQFKWTYRSADFEKKMGTPGKTWPSSNTRDYLYKGWKIRIEYENDLPVMISFQKDPNYRPVAANGNTPIKLDTLNAKAEVNWPILKQLIVSLANLKPFTGRDSVDYFSEVYYSTPYKTEGFDRTAIKHDKKKDLWWYETFYKAGSDSNRARNIFISLYDELKKRFTENTDKDFIAGLVAKMHISESPVIWMGAWSLYDNYKTLPAGLKKLKITLLLSGMKDAFRNDQMDYTFKICIASNDIKVDFFTWDKPK